MKKKKTKEEKMSLEKIASLIENLARFTINGFDKMEAKMETLATKDELSLVKEDVSLLAGEVSSLAGGVSSLKGEVSSLKEEQKETNRRLGSIERKQLGILLSLDETVHRSEFEELTHRVEALES
jgi:polyhydroxyalkanoate synthesis regulator phasin